MDKRNQIADIIIEHVQLSKLLSVLEYYIHSNMLVKYPNRFRWIGGCWFFYYPSEEELYVEIRYERKRIKL